MSLAGALALLFDGRSVAGLGDGRGEYRRLILSSGSVIRYDAYDGAPNIRNITGGQVNSFIRLIVIIFGRPFGLMPSDRCLSVLSACDVGVLWPNHRWMDLDESWYGGRTRPRPHCVRWRPNSPTQKGAQPPIFGPCLLWPNGWMDQNVTWHGGRQASAQATLVIWGPSSPTERGTAAPPPLFGSLCCGTFVHLSCC